MAQATQSTKDYNKFKFLMDNRDTARAHINRLKEAIRHNPSILEVQPLLVNEKMEVIDGQHRLLAASELGLPVSYNVVRGLDIGTAREMNILQRKWGIEDYARSYAKAGNVHYKAFLEYHNDYPGISPSVLILLMQKNDRYDRSSNFRTGGFIIGRDQDEVEEYLARFQKIRETIEIPFSGPLARALIQCFDNEEFDYERFIANLEKKPDAIGRSTVVRDYLRMIEDVYNYHVPEAYRIRLY